MQATGFVGVLIVAALALVSCGPPAPASPVVAYENARWFNGSTFEAHTMYVAGRRFVERPARIDSTIDLAGGYVVPPFGEAHNHNIAPSGRLDEVIHRYMQAGVFYIQNPNALPRARDALVGRMNTPNAPDVTLASGGITGPGGHPIEIVQANMARGLWTASDGEGAFFFSVANRSDLDRVWRALLSSRPDFVKVYLLYSEEYTARLADPTTVGWRGLNPDLLPEIVGRARDVGLRVVAHVESAGDFHVAIVAGVDQVAHMPGFRGDRHTALRDPSRYEISEEDARAAARQQIVVVTTLAGLANYADERGDTALREAADRLHQRNLTTLQRSGVPIAIGSDEYDDTSAGEAIYLASLGVIGQADLLRSWSETTPQAIFPGRQIGRLAPDYEASFLVLSGDPLMDFAQVTRIRIAVKQGLTVKLQ